MTAAGRLDHSGRLATLRPAATPVHCPGSGLQAIKVNAGRNPKTPVGTCPRCARRMTLDRDHQTGRVRLPTHRRTPR